MTPEHRLMNEIRLWCGEHNLICFRCNVGKVRMADGRWFDTGLPEGFSDLMIFDDSGHICFVETKIHPRKPTNAQVNFLKNMNDRGFGGFVCYDLAEFIAKIGQTVHFSV